MVNSRWSTFLSLTFTILLYTTSINGQANPSKPNEFKVLFEFEDVAPNCCPGALPSCGDGKCNRTETCVTCPQDCSCAYCGDSICDASIGENCTSCQKDCGLCLKEMCGDGKCEFYNETCEGCPQDCGLCVVCGDGTCDFTEDCDTCPQDCGRCDLGAVSGSVVDLITLQVIPNATVTTFGYKSQFLTQLTNDDGIFYFLQMPPGLVTIQASHPLYGGPQTVQIAIRKNTATTLTIFLGPRLRPDEWWVVLRWFNAPADLDLTFFGDYASPPYTSGVVDWQFKNRTAALPFTELVFDAQSPSAGVEILKIQNASKNTQKPEIWVHNWSKDRRNNTEEFIGSNAAVSLIKGIEGVVQTVNLTAGVTADEALQVTALGQTWWHVWNILPATSTFETINRFHNGSAALCGFINPPKNYCPYKPLDSTLKK